MNFPQGESLFSKISRGTLTRPSPSSDLPDPSILEILRALPIAKQPPDGGRDAINALIGATIVNFGAPEDDTGLEGGGLAIDYIPEGSSETRRIVFSFNECGMSIAWEGPMNAAMQHL